MIPETARPHQSKRILFIGETSKFPTPHRPPAYYFYKYLKELGHQVVKVVSTDFPTESLFDYQMIRQKFPAFDPELILVVESYPLFNRFDFASITQAAPIPTVLGSLDTPLRFEAHAQFGKYFNYVFTPHREYLDYFKKQCGVKTFLLLFACDPDVHKPYSKEEQYDLAFVGTASAVPDLYRERIAYLQSLKNTFHCAFYETISDEQMVQIYAEAKMVFNYAVTNGFNRRIFDVLSCGKLLLTNRTPALDGIFDDKVHLICYDNLPHLENLIHYYLDNPEKRAKIAAQGHYQVWKKHTMYHRIDVMLRRIFGESIYLSE